LPRQIVTQYEHEGMHSQQPNDRARRPTPDRSRNIQSAAAPPRRSGGRRRIAGKLSPVRSVRCGGSLIAAEAHSLRRWCCLNIRPLVCSAGRAASLAAVDSRAEPPV
jgi:hypothetical protein